MLNNTQDQIHENIKEPIQTGSGIVRLLKEYGISTIFGIPDGHTLAFYDGIYNTEGITHILVNDERTAIFAADAYARVSGTLGVCDAGAAGALNFPIGLAEAKGFGSPILAIIGVVKSKYKLRNVPHDINIQDTLTPITKWCQTAILPEHIPRFLEFGIRQALNGKPGPVALIIPEDVFEAKEIPLKAFLPKLGGSCAINGCNIAPARIEIEKAAEMIRNANQPVLFTGSQALLSGAYSEVQKLAEILNSPVFSTISGKGIMKEDSKGFYFGTVGLFGEKPNHKFIRKSADLMIVVGNRLTEDDTANFKIPNDKMNMIQIDIDPAEIGLSYRPLGIIGDVKTALHMLIEDLINKGITTNTHPKDLIVQRQNNCAKLREEHLKYREKDLLSWIDAEPIKPQRILHTLAANMHPEDYLITDASSSSRWIGAYFPVKETGRKIIAPRGIGPTGFGLGALIGTCIALKESKNHKNKIPTSILLTGDGGLMNGGLSDLETIKNLNLDCTIIVLNNAALGFVKFGQAMLYKQRYYDTNRNQFNFADMVSNFGGVGHRIKNLQELDEILPQVLHTSGLKLLDIIIDPDELLPPNFY